MDPDQALGWETVALDGLSCFLRCIESVLDYRGFSPTAIAQGLAGPIDLSRRLRSASDFEVCRIEWVNRIDGRRNGGLMRRHLAEDEPVIVMPDRYYWPGDEFEGLRHFHDHMVLAYEIEAERLFVLDIDAPPEDDYIRSLPFSDRVQRACTRVGRVKLLAAPGAVDPEILAARWFPISLDLLASDIPTLRAGLHAWSDRTLTYVLARGLHVLVLGDFQPILYLFARALDGNVSKATAAVRTAALDASIRAKKLGLLLLALHLEEGGDRYKLALHPMKNFISSLEALMLELASATGASIPDIEEVGAELFHSRLLNVTEWCFDSSIRNTATDLTPEGTQ